jgi:hypothetical protein
MRAAAELAELIDVRLTPTDEQRPVPRSLVLSSMPVAPTDGRRP